jgi:hypothetical protein
MATNAEILESTISSVVNTKYREELPTDTEFEETAAETRLMCGQKYPVSDEEFADIKRRLRANITVAMDVGVVIKDTQPHQSWLPARRADLDFFFWNRYKNYLAESKHWNPRVIGTLDRVSDEIVDLLGNPKSDAPFQRRGLVLGDVQSGKTANYTAICNKAADAGYRVIIILAGMMENLRQQTQERLDMEFSGRMSQYLLDPKREIENVPVGVGRYRQDKRIETFTSVIKDFDKNILRALNLSLHSVSSTVVFVVKKNKSILNNLIRWLQNSNTNEGEAIDLPMLLIDDESDHASVNTNDEEKDPTAINDAIRRLLKLFRQSSYIGVTATPFANIFINPETTDENCGDDLFPRDFIYLLSPPSGYIGAESIFGEAPAFENCLEELSPSEMDAYFPFKHKKNLTVDELPPSMKEAIAYFMLVNGIRDVRGDTTDHRSMMIHVSLYTGVQNEVGNLIDQWVRQVRFDMQNYARLSEADSSKIESIAHLKIVWNKHNLVEKAGMPWHHFLSDHLFKAVAPIEVRTVNQQNSAVGLNYHAYKDNGLRVIAVGGNSLSRGLTLEGLCVSYFYRKSQMYDTLLQMGRWFGYRPNYDDLFKIWISVDAIYWYGYITAASEELKREIAKMKSVDQTPMEFGLKVRQSPASLIITARNKMRTAEEVSCPIAVSGRLLETPRLRADTASLQDNERVFKNFVKRLAQTGKHTPLKKNTWFWKGVHKGEIENLLRDFKTHPWHQDFQGDALADYVKSKMTNTGWDVVIAEGSAAEYSGLVYADKPLSMKPESRCVIVQGSAILVSGTKIRVGAGGATKIGLDDDQCKQIEDAFKRNHGKKYVPDSEYLVQGRNPILMLHVIEVNRTKRDKPGNYQKLIEDGTQVPDYLFAIGVGFPSTGEKEETATYMVNKIEQRTFFEFLDEEDNDE